MPATDFAHFNLCPTSIAVTSGAWGLPLPPLLLPGFDFHWLETLAGGGRAFRECSFITVRRHNSADMLCRSQ